MQPLIEEVTTGPRSHPVAGLNQMKPFPAVALRAFRLLGDDRTETRELVAAISPDPIFVANLLQCANSALIGATREVKTVQHAMAVLGRNRLRGLILTAALRSFKNTSSWTTHCQNWWRHSVATALLAEGLASATSTYWPASYSAGLLHDIGRLALLLGLSKERAMAYEAAVVRSADPVVEIERRMFGESHCDAGASLLRQWRFPEEFIRAAEHHHDAGGECLVKTGCQLAAAMGLTVFCGRPVKTSSEVLASFEPAIAAGLEEMPRSVVEALYERIDSFEQLPPIGAKS